MKTLLVALAAGSLAVAASNAAAAVLVYAPGDYAQRIHNGHQGDGDRLLLMSQGLHEVEFTADGTLNPNGNGFAQLDGPYTFLTINPLDVGFSRMGLTIRPDLAAAGLHGNPVVTFDLMVSFVGGQPSQVLRGTLPGNGKIDIWAEEAEVLDAIRLSNLATVVASTSGRGRSRVTTFVETPLQFDDVRHVSFDPLPPLAQPAFGALNALSTTPVPEPTSWVIMLTGFFSLGGLLRWRRGRERLARPMEMAGN